MKIESRRFGIAFQCKKVIFFNYLQPFSPLATVTLVTENVTFPVSIITSVGETNSLITFHLNHTAYQSKLSLKNGV